MLNVDSFHCMITLCPMCRAAAGGGGGGGNVLCCQGCWGDHIMAHVCGQL